MNDWDEFKISVRALAHQENEFRKLEREVFNKYHGIVPVPLARKFRDMKANLQHHRDLTLSLALSIVHYEDLQAVQEDVH